MLRNMSVEEIRQYVTVKNYDLSPNDIALLRKDTRKGVQVVLEKLERRQAELAKEEARLVSITETENALWRQGYQRVLGMDEVGRGPLAGPVTVAGVVFAPHTRIAGINDSKVLTARRREELAVIIKSAAPLWAIASRDNAYIDEHGIVASIRSCQLEIIDKLCPDYLLLDAFALPDTGIPQLAIVKGDSRSISIGAASIIAKVHRDELMVQKDREYPDYGFASHKGYGCREHYEALFKLGPCSIHRHSFLSFMDKEYE